jgi:hypothetical protein
VLATQTISERLPIIVRVHGTGAALADDSGQAWWQCGSPVETELANRLTKTAECERSAFHWSGANTESARQLGAIELAAHIASLERESKSYHLLGHSHGGSVIWMALKTFCEKGQSLPGLKSWTTVGTPYLHYRPVPVAPIAFLPLVVFVLLALPSHLWRSFAAKSLATSAFEAYVYRAEIAFHQGTPILIILALLALVLGALCFASLFQLATTMYRLFSFGETQKLNLRTFAMFHERGLVVWSPDDEAINGLTSTLALSGDIVPRLPKAQGNWWKRVVRTFAAPIRMVFNLFFAPIADLFIWQSVTDRLQGSDFPGWELAMVSNSPCPDVGRWGSLEKPIAQRLLDQANTFASKTVANMRAILGLASQGGHDRTNVLIGLRSQLTFEELIHTSYFRDPDVLTLICNWIAGVTNKDLKDSSVYGSSTDGEFGKVRLLCSSRKRVSLFPAFSTAVMLVLFAFIALLEKSYVAPHTEENIERIALSEGTRLSQVSSRSNLAGIHHWLQALVYSGHSDRAMSFAQQASDGAKIEAYLSIALADAQIGDLHGIDDSLDKIRALPKPEPGFWANNTNFVLRTLIDADHPAAAKVLALRAASLSEAISEPFSQAGELADLARSLARIGEKQLATEYARRAREILIANNIDNSMIWGTLAGAFYLVGDGLNGRDAALKSLAAENNIRTDQVVTLYEDALHANDRETAQEIMRHVLGNAPEFPAAPLRSVHTVRTQTDSSAPLGEIGEADLPFMSKVYAISIVHGIDCKELITRIPPGWVYKFTNLSSIELAERGALDKAIEEADGYTILGANHMLIAALARALVTHGYAARAVSEASQVENEGQRSSSLALVALSLSRVDSCSGVPSLVTKSDGLLKTAKFVDDIERTHTLIMLGQALAGCKSLANARIRLQEALLQVDAINDPMKRTDLIVELNKAFVRQASFFDALNIARRAFTPQNELDLYSDILLENSFVKNPTLEKEFKPLRDETIYEM